MASLTDWAEGKMLDHSLRIASWTMPTGLSVALYTTATTDAGGGTEVVGGSYARQTVTFGAGSVSNERSNSVSVIFPNMPAVTVTHAAVWDTTGGGNMMYHGALTSPVIMVAGNAFAFNIGDIDVQLT
jgi:hypothetical protein